MKPLAKLASIPNRGALIAFAAVCVVGAAGEAVYFVARRPESPLFTFLYYVGFAGALGYWITSDSRRLQIRRAPDQGFVFWAWPVAFPWYVFKTRGRRGFKTVGGFLAIFFGTYVTVVVVYQLCVLWKPRH